MSEYDSSDHLVSVVVVIVVVQLLIDLFSETTDLESFIYHDYLSFVFENKLYLIIWFLIN